MEPLRVPDDVKLVRWPAEEARRARYRALGVARLLIVEGGAEPPVAVDAIEDWVRTPVERADFDARVAAVRARCRAERWPQVDPRGVVHFAGGSVTVSPTATDLLCLLVRHFGEVVERSALRQCLPEREGCTSRNALDLQMMRLRKRIAGLGLTVTTVWGRGYLLEEADEPMVELAGGTASPTTVPLGLTTPAERRASTA